MISTQRRLFGVYMLLIIFPVVFSGSVVYTTVDSVFRSMSGRQSLRMLKAVDLALRTAMREIDGFSDLIITSPETQTLLNAGNRADVRDRVDIEALERSVVGLLTGTARVRGAALYGTDRLLLEYGEPGALPFSRFSTLFAFFQTRNAQGRPVWFGPFENADLMPPGEQGRRVITQIRRVKDYYSLKDIGYLVLHLDVSLIGSLFFELFQGEDDGVFLLSPGFLVLFGNDPDLEGKRLPLFDVVPSSREGYFFSRYGGEKVLASYFRSDTDWVLASLSSWEKLERTGSLFRNATVMLLIPFLALAFILNFYFVRGFTRFVDSLSQAMHRLRGGDLAVRLPPVRGREYSLLREDFNSMAERLGELVRGIEHEQAVKRDAEFRMLQAQIKPHFLYNTLESINALASMNGQKEIQKITVNLGKLLRLSIAREDFLSITDEVAHVRAYLEIQKIRYSNRFEYDIDIDPRMSRSRVVKLILQPLVENALSHGLDACETGGRVSIRGIVEKEGADGAIGSFTVRDNGSGIPEAVLLRLNAEASFGGASSAVPSLGHGLLNVRERLILTYGRSYGLFACNNGDGTIVKILFPLTEGGTP